MRVCYSYVPRELEGHEMVAVLDAQHICISQSGLRAGSRLDGVITVMSSCVFVFVPVCRRMPCTLRLYQCCHDDVHYLTAVLLQARVLLYLSITLFTLVGSAVFSWWTLDGHAHICLLVQGVRRNSEGHACVVLEQSPCGCTAVQSYLTHFQINLGPKSRGFGELRTREQSRSNAGRPINYKKPFHS